MLKDAALKADVELQPHQARALAKIQSEPSVLLYHGLGSGKTLSSIAAGEALGGRKEVVVPASLRENYKKELRKFVKGAPKLYNIKSYHKATAEGLDPAALTIFDEAHRMGRADTQLSQLPKQVSGKSVFLTGTPVRNEPSELMPLLKAIAGDRNPPQNEQAFKETFLGSRKISPGFFKQYILGVKPGAEPFIRNKERLSKLVQGRVDYHAASGEYPSVKVEQVDVEMTPRQTSLYNVLMKSNPALAFKVRYNLPPSKKESKELNAFLGAVRQVSNNPQSYDVTMKGSAVSHSPKLQRVMSDLQEGLKSNKNFKALVYSNYLDSGVKPLAAELENNGISYGLFTGELNDKQRSDLVKRYNSNDIRVLLVSGAGSEGLDLKGTKLVQLLEPHWNKARLDQVIGRAVRHRSHAHLPEKERNVTVRHYFSTPKPGLLARWGLTEPDTGADRYLEELSNRKQTLIEEMLSVLRAVGREPVSIKETQKKVAADYAPGLPDPKRFGDVTTLPRGKELPFVIQRHLAERAGPHYDVRFGPDKMFSWATKKELPAPGEKRMLFQQPLHTGQYASFEGEITSGYGKGTVKTHDKGHVIVETARPDLIKFTVTHRKTPENFTLIRTSGPSRDPASPRARRTQGGSWLMVNTTPVSAAKLLGGDPEAVGMKKVRYTSIPAAQVDKVFDPKYLVQEKVDGASALFHLLSDRINVLSYRTSKEGKPIVHTYRVFGEGGSKTFSKIPPELEGTILKGELYGERKGKAIPPQELGGILNASVHNALKKQREQQVKMKAMLFDIVRQGKTDNVQMGAEDRMKRLSEIVRFLPKGKFSLPETANTPAEAKNLYERIISGKHPRTQEGVVAWPREPGKTPIKVKPRPERDVWIKSIFPGEGKLKGTSAGGFEYSTSPEGGVLGRVGTGFSEQTRKEMLADPDSWIGRMARVNAQEAFPSGALRAPSFVALHEDYPMKSAAFAKVAAFLIKEAIPKQLVEALQTRMVNNLKQLTGAKTNPAVVADINRTLAALTRVRAGEHGYRLARTVNDYAMQPGQKISPTGFGQGFVNQGNPAMGRKPSLIALDVNALPQDLGKGMNYELNYLQGSGSTRGNALRLHSSMMDELRRAHEAAGKPFTVGLFPGRSMPDPKSYDIVTRGNAGLDVNVERASNWRDYDKLDALRMWLGLRGKNAFTHYKYPLESLNPLTDEVRNYLRFENPASTPFLRYEWSPQVAPVAPVATANFMPAAASKGLAVAMAR